MTKNLQSMFASVRGALMRRGRTEHDADDLLQEAWVRLACYEREHPVDKPEAFLMRVALNLSIDAHRLRQNHGEEVQLEHAVLVDAAPSTEAVLLARERVARLSICLGRLTEKTRVIFLAHRIDGLSYQEIADQHNMSTSAVAKHVAKALLLITTWMEDW